MTSDPVANGAIALFWFVVVLFIYFLPAFIARKKRNGNAVCMLNLFLGWTLIGWVVALCWGLMNDAPPVVVQQITHSAFVGRAVAVLFRMRALFSFRL